jgi:4-diphosphocytidyl-2-C-methyl-D-erythritol kinase
MLRVDTRHAGGLHPVSGLMQSIAWADHLDLEEADEDGFELDGPGPNDETNLAWQAVERVRARHGTGPPLRLALRKEIPIAAGLGGGSADAAAALVLAVRYLGADEGLPGELAFDLGADVPFSLEGGLAEVGGYGEEVTRIGSGGGYALALVVPPFELATAEVYAAWDRLGGPEGPRVEGPAIPPPLRGVAPLVNDLYPAAVALAPDLADWRADLERAWGRPASLSGSGPALFSFFVDEDEARGAAGAVPHPARAARGAATAARGWRIEGGTLR